MTSPSTLIRQANATKDKQKAAKLRARAAKLRRSIRATKAAGGSARMVTADDVPTRKQAAERAEVAAHLHAVTTGQPMIKPEHITYLRKAALKRDSEFEIGLRALFVDGKVAAIRERADQRKIDDENAVRRLRDFNEAVAIKVVSSFMARIKGMEAGNQPLPAFFVLDGYTAARVYDALRDAGYTTEGKQGGIRKA